MTVVAESVMNGRLNDYILARNAHPLLISATSFNVLSSVIHYFGKKKFWLIDAQQELHDSSFWNNVFNGLAFVVTDLMEWNQQVLTAFAQGHEYLVIPSSHVNNLELSVAYFFPRAILSTEAPEVMAARYGVNVNDILAFTELTVAYDVASSDED